jgi:hypothetical protein
MINALSRLPSHARTSQQRFLTSVSGKAKDRDRRPALEPALEDEGFTGFSGMANSEVLNFELWLLNSRDPLIANFTE